MKVYTNKEIMKYDESIYDDKWIKSRTRYHKSVNKIMKWFIEKYGPFSSSIDLGAGDGWYSHILSSTKARTIAVDVHDWKIPKIDKEVKCITHDLRFPLNLNETFDLVLCIEVAEHLPESSADILCDTISNHANNMLVFTAAPPGQDGDGHINCQPKKYWDKKLKERGFNYLPYITENIKKEWESILKNKMWWLYTNIMVYKK